MAERNPLMAKLKRDFTSYLDLLVENEYVLALPDSAVLQYCVIDDSFIRNSAVSIPSVEHILQNSYDGKELQSLSGKVFAL